MSDQDEWKPTVALEQKKLNGEAGWALAGATSTPLRRTRGKSRGSGYYLFTRNEEDDDEDNNNKENESPKDDESPQEEPTAYCSETPPMSSLPKLTRAPGPSRVIVDANPLINLLEELKCPECNGSLIL